jgi:hypothetical protein
MGTMTKRQANALRVLRRRLSLQNAGFSKIGPADSERDGALPTSEKEVTEFIRKRTRLYLQTWILPIVNNLLAEAEGRPVRHGHYVLDRLEKIAPTASDEVRVHSAQRREDDRALRTGRPPRVIATVDDIDDESP